MSLAKSAARFALHRMGGLRLLQSRNRGKLRILMYHRFPAPNPDVLSALHRQMSAFRSRYNVISMSEAADCLELGKPFPANAMVITVDDGYRDFFTTAYPVLKDLGLPAILYLVSGFLDRELWLWTDQVHFLCGQTQQNRSTIAVGEQSLSLDFSTAARREASASQLIQVAKKMPDLKRRELWSRLPEHLGVSLPDQAPAVYEPATWPEVRTMARDGIEFGAHTHTHPILSRVEDPIRMRWEVETSQRRIAEELGTPTQHFCYPNGRPEDYTPAIVECVRDLGFRTAVTTTLAMNRMGAPKLLLTRLGMEPESPLAYALERAEGMHTEAPSSASY